MTSLETWNDTSGEKAGHDPFASSGPSPRQQAPADLQATLSRIADQIASTTRGQTRTLDAARARADRLAMRAEALGHDLAGEDADALASHTRAQPEYAMPDQADGLSEALPVFEDDHTLGEAAGEGGWDPRAAEALMQSYREDMAPPAPAPARKSGDADARAQPAAASEAGGESEPMHCMGADAEWLNERFADIANRIEQVLAADPSEQVLAALEPRLDSVEQRLEELATRSLGEEGIEAVLMQIDELRNAIDRAETHIARIETVEDHVVRLIGDLSGTREDMARVAEDAAGQALAAIPAPESAQESEIAGQLEAIEQRIAALAEERPHPEAESATAGTLETIQSTLEALASRLDSIETNMDAVKEAARAPSPAPAAPMPPRTQEADGRSGDPQAPAETSQEVDWLPATEGTAKAYDLADENAGEADVFRTPPAQAADAAPQAHARPASASAAAPTSHAGAGASSAGEPPAASAPMARQGASTGESAAPSASEAERESFIASARRAARAAAQQAASRASESQESAVKPAAKLRKALFSFNKGAPRPVIVLTIVALLIAGAGMLYGKVSRDEAPMPPALQEKSLPAEASKRSDAADRLRPPAASTPDAAGQAERTRTGAAPAPAPWPEPALRPREEDDSNGAAGSTPARRSMTGLPAQGMGTGATSGTDADLSRLEVPPGFSIRQLSPRAKRTASAAARAGQRPAPGQAKPASPVRPASLAPSMPAEPQGHAMGSVNPAPDLPPAAIAPYSIRIAAAKGDPVAAFEIADRYARGRGVPVDAAAAVRWYERAAAKGLARAQFRLAAHYERGRGVTKDLGRARIWYRRAAEKGHVKAMHNLAVLHTGQNGGAADYATAAFWFRKAAERGLPDSQFNLAILSENGLGVERNLVEAYVWYSVAARQGDKEAARRRNRLKARLGVKALKIAERRARRWRALPIDATVRAPRAQSRSARGRAS